MQFHVNSVIVILEFEMFNNIFLLLFFEQACFTFRQSVGVIGGKPNHAYYFIGFYGKFKFDFLVERNVPSQDFY